MCKRTFAVNKCGTVSAGCVDERTYSVRHVGNDKQGSLLIGLVQYVKRLSCYILEYHGIERFVPTKDDTCNCKDDDITCQNIREGINSFFL